MGRVHISGADGEHGGWETEKTDIRSRRGSPSKGQAVRHSTID